MDTSDENMEAEEALPTPETVDPRQQTLLRFFQPRPQSTLPFKPSREALAPRANETAIEQDDAARQHSFNQGGSTPDGIVSDGFNADVDMDMDMDMDTDQSSEGSNFGSKMGLAGWI